MDELLAKVAGLFVDKCLSYPISCSLLFFAGFYTFVPVFWKESETRTEGRRWLLSCVAGFVLLALILTALIPSLQMTTDRVIFRSSPTCSIFDDPARYICSILNENHKQVFYITNTRGCKIEDPKMKNATQFYIISSWIPSFNHFRTIRTVQFQPATVPGENKPSYPLPNDYCIRAAGPVSDDLPVIKVAFYSQKGTQRTLLDTGYINKTDLLEFHFGWYLISSCRTDIERWLFQCETGYLSSHYVALPEYSRSLLLENAAARPKT